MSNDESHTGPELAVCAMERIIESLTRAQQEVLVNAMRNSRRRDVITVDSANERTIGSLMRGKAPLVWENRLHRRVLTGLGKEVAKYLISTRDTSMIDIGSIIPDLTRKEENE